MEKAFHAVNISADGKTQLSGFSRSERHPISQRIPVSVVEMCHRLTLRIPFYRSGEEGFQPVFLGNATSLDRLLEMGRSWTGYLSVDSPKTKFERKRQGVHVCPGATTQGLKGGEG